MHIGEILILIGTAFVLGTGVVYVLANPEKIGEARAAMMNFLQSARKSQDELKGLNSDLHGGRRVPDTEPIDDQFSDLRIGEMAEIGPGSTKTEYKATGTGFFKAQNRDGRNYADRGEDWPVWNFQNKWLVFQRPEGWYAFPFDSRIALPPEEVTLFSQQGEIFSDGGQKWGSTKFRWNDQNLAILDVGYLHVSVTAGNIGTTDNMYVKYVLARNSKGDILFCANNMTGTDYMYVDGVSIGKSVKPFVGTLTRAA